MRIANPLAGGLRNSRRTVLDPSLQDRVLPASGTRLRDPRTGERSAVALLTRVAAHDPAALTQLHDETAPWIHSLVLHLVGDHQVAEETVMDVYVQVWRSADAFDETRGRALTWLLAIARHRAIDRLRSRTAGLDQEQPLVANSVSDTAHTAGPLENELREERRNLVRTALTTLPKEERRVIELAYHGGLTHRQIAIELGAPLGTVKTRIRRALQRLELALAGAGETET